ncbi:MAG TPA: hypothetical protein VHC69_14585 [Polyangiaceae bacterium]|nr:hypothetical protein [Polyangiaceae bacterium]
MTRGAVAIALGLSATLLTSGARAGLAADADAVAVRYAKSAIVFRPSPKLYGSGGPEAVTLPVEATLSPSTGCTTVVAIGAVSTAFALSLPGGDEEDDGSEQVATSIAGLAEMTRCGERRAELAELTIEVRSPHAVIEWIVATSNVPLLLARSILPHRDPGNVLPLQRPGPPPSPGPVAARVLRLESRLAREEMAHVERRMAAADGSGAGRVLLELSPGCHRITVFDAPADQNDADFHDIDAELAWASGGIASIDRTESPDAALVACTAEHELGILAFAGAGKGGSVVVVHGITDLPAGVPARWGAARARVARTLLERHIPAPASSPVYESLGVAGLTVLPLELEPGRCYLAAVASLQGDVKLIALNAVAFGPAAQSHVDDTDEAAAVTFCAGTTPRGRLEVEVHGASPIWLAAVWPFGERRLGEEMP